MSLFVIGLAGRAGAGKSTVARRLVEEWGASRHPFAAPLKNMLLRFLEDQGLDHETARRMVDGDLKEAPSDHLGGRSPRAAMQSLGTEWGRGLAPSLWVDAWRRAIEDRPWPKAVDGRTVLIVADDVRFPNEVAAIRATGGVVIRIDRPGVGLTGRAGDHPSEAGDIGAPDMVLVNDGDLERLCIRVDAIASGVMD